MRIASFLVLMTLGACTVSSHTPAEDELSDAGVAQDSTPMCPPEEEVEYHSCYTFDAWTCESGVQVLDPEGCGCYCEPAPERRACGGFAGLECAEGEICVDDSTDDCGPAAGGADCGGFCEAAPERRACNGFAALPCAEGETCVDDTSDDCEPGDRGAHCGGFCEPTPERRACNGFAALPCADGEMCVDDTSDDCEPGDRGAHCGGYCEPNPLCPAADEVQYRSCFTLDAWSCPSELQVSEPDGCGCYCLPAE